METKLCIKHSSYFAWPSALLIFILLLPFIHPEIICSWSAKQSNVTSFSTFFHLQLLHMQFFLSFVYLHLCCKSSQPAKSSKCWHACAHLSTVFTFHEQATSAVTSRSASCAAQHFPTSVLLQEQRDECRPILRMHKEEKTSQVHV